MPKHLLYAYVDGSDLHELEESLLASFDNFVDSREWTLQGVKVVNQRHDEDDSLSEGDLPGWDLGLNVDLPDVGQEPEGWFADVEAIATWLGGLHVQTRRDFIIGIFDTDLHTADDLFDVGSEQPDINELREIIGVPPPRLNNHEQSEKLGCVE